MSVLLLVSDFQFTCTAETRVMSKANGICESLDFFECHFAVILWKVFTPVLLVVGLSGNIMSLWVLSKKRMSSTTTSVYLRLLAVSDSLVLLTGVLRQLILIYKQTDVREMSTFTCKCLRWLSSSTSGLSYWLLVTIALDRLILIKYSIWARSHCTKRAAIIMCIILTVTVFSLHSHFVGFLDRQNIYTTDNVTNTTHLVDVRCTYTSVDYGTFLSKVYPLFILVFYNITPIVCLIACNVILFKELSQRNTQMRKRHRVISNVQGNN